MSEELKPCPFCGYVMPEAELDSEVGHYSNQGTKWGGVQCGACLACGPEIRTGYLEWKHWRENAVTAWNRRAKEPV